MGDVLVLNHAQVEALLPMARCIDLMAGALAALARGQVYQPLRMIVRPPEARGLLVLMPAYVHDTAGSGYGVKAIGVFPENPARGLDAHQGAVLLYSGDTGELLALMNASAITAIRTAAVSGLATRLLARPDARYLALIGSGVQARAHLAAMAAVRQLERVRVASLHPAHAQKFAAEMGARYDFPIEAVDSPEAALRGADIVVTATSAAEPVVRREWLALGTHINAIGTYSPTTREIDTATMAAARLFVDRRESVLSEAGDYLLPLAEGAIGADHIQAELGDVVTGVAHGRRSREEITLFKSLGLPVEDLAAARELYAQARAAGAGTWVSF